MNAARRSGLITLGLAFGAGGSASLVRASYLPFPAWRTQIAWGFVGIAIVLLVAALWNRKISA